MRNNTLHARLWWGLFAGICLFVTGRAHADTVVIVPPQVEQGVLSEQSESAVDALARVLKVDGFNVVLPGQAGPAAEEAQERKDFPTEFDPLSCVSRECADAFKRLFDAAFAIQLSLQRKPGHPVRLTVVIVESATVFFTGSSGVEGGDVAGGLRDAYHQAREHQAEGVGPWLTVVGTPEGAVVYVDGSEFGTLPIKRRRLASGTHRLVLHADGYTSLEDTVEIPDRIDHEESREFHLEPTATERPSLVESERNWPRRGVLDWVVGGTVFAAGAVYAVAGGIAYAKEGDCTERTTVDTQSVCTTRVKPNGLTLAKLAGGSAAALLGIGLVVWGPFGLYGSADSNSAHFSLHGKF